MKKEKIILTSVAIVILLVGGFYLTIEKQELVEEPVKQKEPSVTTQEEEPTFEWSYTYSSKSDIPRSTIHLTAKYPSGASTTKQIETIEGTCNEYENRDPDVYPKSQMIICYYAGFGRYYKVVEEGASYAIKRKEFEEASPDYNPPIAPFETLVRF